MTTPENALKWLTKLYRQKEIALYNATRKRNRNDQEIDDILEALDVIDYLIEITGRMALNG